MRRVLAALITVMEQPTLGLTALHSHLQGIQNQLRAHVICHRPAHQLPVVEVEYHRQIEPSFQPPEDCDIDYLSQVRHRYHELAVQQVGFHRQDVQTVGRMTPASPLPCLDAGFPHQAADLVTANLVATAPQFFGHAAAALAAALPAMDVSGLSVQGLSVTIRATLSPGIETPAADPHDSTQHGHGVGGLLRLDELVSQLDSLVKKAVNFLEYPFPSEAYELLRGVFYLGVTIVLLPLGVAGNLLMVLATPTV